MQYGHHSTKHQSFRKFPAPREFECVQKVGNSYPLREMQFPRPVEPEDGVKVSWRAVKVVLAAAVRKVVAELLDT